MMGGNEHRAYEFLGIRVHALTKAELLQAIESTVAYPPSNSIIGHHNLHSLYLFQKNAAMRRFYCQSVYTYIDGMSLVFLARVLGIPLKRCHRATSLDWFEDLLRLAERKSWRIYFLGGRPEVADEVRDYFCALFPGLKIRSHHGYDAFSPETTVYEEIKKFVPHIVMVGMGMPLQEQWILESLDRVQTNLILSCGGLMDYYMGAQRPAPRWLGQMGLEWLYRLLHEPRRLFFRYVIEPVTLIPLCFREWRGKKHYANEREV